MYLPKTKKPPCTHMLTGSLHQKVERIQCPSTAEWINKLWHINTVQYYLGIKNENMDKNIMLSERNQPQKATYYDSIYIKCLEDKSIKTEK